MSIHHASVYLGRDVASLIDLRNGLISTIWPPEQRLAPIVSPYRIVPSSVYDDRFDPMQRSSRRSRRIRIG